MKIKSALITLLLITISSAELSIDSIKFIDKPIGNIDNLNSKDAKPYKKGDVFDLSEQGIYALTAEINWDKNEVKTPTLYLGPSLYSTRITLNDKEIYHWGEFNKGVTTGNLGATYIILTGIKKGSNRVTIYLNSDGERNQLPLFDVGSYKEMALKSSIQTFFNLYLTIGIGIIALFSGLLFLAYSLAYQKDKDILYFSMFAFGIFMGCIHFIFNAPINNELLWIKVSRVGYLFAAYFVFKFIGEYTGLLKNRFKVFKKILIAILSIFVLFILISSTNGILADRFSIVSAFFILPILLLSFVLIARHFIKDRSVKITILFISYTLFLITTFYDISFAIGKQVPYAWTTVYGYFSLIMGIIYSLAIRYKEVHKKVVDYKTRLLNTNSELEMTLDTLKISEGSRDAFIKAISHEFKTPINGMNGLINSLVEDKNIIGSAQEKTDLIALSFYRFELIVQNLLDYAEIKSGKIEIQKYPFSPAKTINKVIDIFRESAKLNDLALTYTNKIALPKLLTGDSIRVSIILKNIIQNALKFTSMGSVEISSSYKEQKLFVTVSDTGCGISEEQKKSIFDSFERGEDSNFLQKYEGIGLGLSITLATVEAMGGKLNLESKANIGSKFTIELPLEISKVKKSKEDNLTVMIVDDNRVNQKVLQMQVEKKGYSVIVASDGLEAVELNRVNDVDFIFMDVQMPKMDGLRATELIKEDYPKLPIIGFTANAGRTECISAGMDDVIFKPASTEVIFDMISTYA